MQPAPIVRGSLDLTGSYLSSGDQGKRTILYAEWTGKNLLVQGEDFADGATILIDGQAFKTSNDHSSCPRFPSSSPVGSGQHRGSRRTFVSTNAGPGSVSNQDHTGASR